MICSVLTIKHPSVSKAWQVIAFSAEQPPQHVSYDSNKEQILKLAPEIPEQRLTERRRTWKSGPNYRCKINPNGGGGKVDENKSSSAVISLKAVSQDS